MQMNREERIKAILKPLNPQILELKNDSAKHAKHVDHMGVNPTGETHYKLKIVSEVFDGLSRIERQRKVYDLLKDEFNNGLHALELKTLTPKEANG